MLLVNHWAAPADATSTGGLSGRGDGHYGSSSSNKGGVGRQVAPVGVQARGDQGQQQDSASLSVCDEGSSRPAYGDLDRELASISSEHLSKQIDECQQILSAVLHQNTPSGGEVQPFGLPAMQGCVDASAALLALAKELQEVGLALCMQLPVPWWCNNPDCTLLAGASELQLVGGKGCVCGGCRVASRSCQAAHWAQHKAVCAQLSGAAAPPAAAVSQAAALGEQ